MIKFLNIISEIKIEPRRIVYITEKGKDLMQKYWQLRNLLTNFNLSDIIDIIYEDKSLDSKLYLTIEALNMWEDEKIISKESIIPERIFIENLENKIGYTHIEAKNHINQLLELELIGIKT